MIEYNLFIGNNFRLLIEFAHCLQFEIREERTFEIESFIRDFWVIVCLIPGQRLLWQSHCSFSCISQSQRNFVFFFEIRYPPTATFIVIHQLILLSSIVDDQITPSIYFGSAWQFVYEDDWECVNKIKSFNWIDVTQFAKFPDVLD